MTPLEQRYINRKHIQYGTGKKGFFRDLIDRYYAKKEEKEFTIKEGINVGI